MGHRKNRLLYLGTDPSHFYTTKELFHMPLMSVKERDFSIRELEMIFQDIFQYSHVIFTSKHSVRVFFKLLKRAGHDVGALRSVYLISLGSLTAHCMKREGAEPTYIATDDTESGVIRLLSHVDLSEANVFIPHSSIPMSNLCHYLVEKGVRHHASILYELHKQIPFAKADLGDFDEVVFTTPLSVEAFFDLYEEIPAEVKLHPLGLNTRNALRSALRMQQGKAQLLPA